MKIALLALWKFLCEFFYRQPASVEALPLAQPSGAIVLVQQDPTPIVSVVRESCILVLPVSAQAAEPNRCTTNSDRNKGKKRWSCKRHYDATLQTVAISSEVLERKDVCWRATGLKVRNGDPLVYAPGLNALRPLIRLVYAQEFGEEPPSILHAGCRLEGEARQGCVNPYPHQPIEHILIEVQKSTLVKKVEAYPTDKYLERSFPSIAKAPLPEGIDKDLELIIRKFHHPAAPRFQGYGFNDLRTVCKVPSNASSAIKLGIQVKKIVRVGDRYFLPSWIPQRARSHA